MRQAPTNGMAFVRASLRLRAKELGSKAIRQVLGFRGKG